MLSLLVTVFFKALVFCMFLMECCKCNVNISHILNTRSKRSSTEATFPFKNKKRGKQFAQHLRLVQFFTQQTLVAAGVVVTCRFPRSLHLSQMPEV